jgi:hypothetical protein
MDLAYFLNQRLSLAEYFHAHSAQFFQEVKNKIESGEPPYADNRNPEYADGPAFLEEWEMADAALCVAGAACLDLLQSTFHKYLEEYMKDIGSKEIIPHLKEMGKKSWFENYRAFFGEHLKIDWGASGADLGLLEQVILTRNDFTHNVDFLSLNSLQSKDHAGKYPDSAFADPRWKAMFVHDVRLTVPDETLQRAIGSLRALCEFLEQERHGLINSGRGQLVWKPDPKKEQGKN